jgi:DNA modification methylase
MGGHVLIDETNSVAVSNIKDENRQRKEYGDVTGLARSIKRFGVIQPIVLQRGDEYPVLVAGGRRLAALRSLGVTLLHHGKEYVWRDEDLSNAEAGIRLQAVELEENLRREDLHWSEVVEAKARLLRLMQSIHGVSKGFGSGREWTKDSGFGIRRLAEMLGENPSTTSRDVELAGFVAKHPMLASLPTRADAQRKLGVAVTVAAMQISAKRSTVTAGSGPTSAVVGAVGTDASPAPPVSQPVEERWTLYEGRFQDNINNVTDGSVDLICTDLPYVIGLGNSTAAHSAGLGQFNDSDIDIVQLCADVAVESYRVLNNNRFGVFFYGMAYHQTLYDALTTAGFTVDVYPFIWLRDRSAPPDGFARYSKTYDPALIVSKGVPRFIQPNLGNSLSIPSVRGADRLHAAQKPTAIMQKFIEDMTTPGCVVLDMFAGAGTTGEAALRCKRKAILFEMESPNCVLIRSRLGAL